MSKRSEVHWGGAKPAAVREEVPDGDGVRRDGDGSMAVTALAGRDEGSRARGQTVGQSPGHAGIDAGIDGRIDEAEHLQQDFARVRAKSATDPAIAPRSLSAAWTTDVIEEEDEAEFVDAVADCVGAGFSLESALTGWDNGTLAADAVEGSEGNEEGSLFDDDAERDRDDEVSRAASLAARHTPSGGRRFFMT